MSDAAVEPAVEPVVDPVVEPVVDPVVEPVVDDPAGKVLWPDKWREQIAGDDEKKLTRLSRFAEPGAVFDSYLELEKEHKSADIRSPFPDEGSDDDKAAWRKGNGLPAEAAGYFEKLPDGLVVGEEDRAGMDMLAEAMHKANAPADVVHAAMGAYYKQVENAVAERDELDAQSKRDTDDALNELYGPSFRGNINAVGKWLDGAAGDVKAKVLGARTPDGTPLGNDPDVLKFLIGQVHEINPPVTVPGLGGGDPMAALEDEIAAIEKVIQMDNAAYQADKPMQARFLTLIDARDKRK